MSRYRRLVFKFGTSTLTDKQFCLSRRQMLELARQVALLHEQGLELIIVTSGAVAAGREVVPDGKPDETLPDKQMLAAVGQVRLMHTWSEFFATYGVVVGQVLLTRGDINYRKHYLNIRDTIAALLNARVVPIVNENDTVATKRLRFGDNDNLAALVANLVDADMLAFITDQKGLFTADPRTDPTAKLIPVVEEINEKMVAAAQQSGSAVGTGGMVTKLQAAKLAVESGTETRIASSQIPDVLLQLAAGQPLGTRFPARETPLESRKRWLLSEPPQGSVRLDEGAVQSLVSKGASLLPVGVVSIEGAFERGAVIDVLDSTGRSVAAGVTNYSSEELERVRGKQSSEIQGILGYSYGAVVIHRDDLTIKRQRGTA